MTECLFFEPSCDWLLIGMGIGLLIMVFLCLWYLYTDDFFLPYDKVKDTVKFDKYGGMHANVESPRWIGMFLHNLEVMRGISYETATKMANKQPITQEEADKIELHKKWADFIYGTKEEIRRGDGVLEKGRQMGERKILSEEEFQKLKQYRKQLEDKHWK